MRSSRLSDQLAYIVASVNRQLEEELQERLRPEGVPIEHLRVLEALDRGGTVSMGELATQALVEPPTLTKIIDRMVSDSLVFRSPDARDRRRVLIQLAPAGKVLCKRLRRVSREQEERLTRQLPRDKAIELRNLLRDLIQHPHGGEKDANGDLGLSEPR
jgi:MarR family transcriptional regulator, organic hydroperoxide resistance regulator